MDKVLILGAGVMGSALAVHLGKKGHKINLWGTQWDGKMIDEMIKTKHHSLLDVDIPDRVDFFYEDELERAFDEVKLVILAVLSQGMDEISKKIKPHLKANHIVLTATKGIDGRSLTTMTGLLEANLPDQLKGKTSFATLGGPIIAKELVQDIYTEAIFASKDISIAEYLRNTFESPKFRANITSDIAGVELCAALKNSYAITMGILEGLEGGYSNPRAAIMARGSMEMATIVKAYGGRGETALGLAGVGDYYVTSQGGRNGRFGYYLGQGMSVEEALTKMNNSPVEGLSATLNGFKLLKGLEKEGSLDIRRELPLFLETYNILYENKPIKEAMNSYWISRSF